MYVKIGFMTYAAAAGIFLSANLNDNSFIQNLNHLSLSNQAQAQTQTLMVTHSFNYNTAQVEPHMAEYETALQPHTDTQTGRFQTVNVDTTHAAAAMLNVALFNNDNNRIGTLHDIIVSRDSGQILEAVLSTGRPLGRDNKLISVNADRLNYDYDRSRYYFNITPQEINERPDFSYDPNAADPGNNLRVLPPEGLSVRRLMNARLTDYNGEDLARIENISFNMRNEIDQVIVIYNQILGMGGDRVAIDYNKIALIDDRNGLRFQLDETQSAEFQDSSQPS